MAPRLTGRVAVITGASAGIGWASALALAAEGARLVVTARRADRLDALAAQIRTRGSDAIAVAGDAREEETAQRTISAAVQTFGGIDILLNNAGVGNYKGVVATSAAHHALPDRVHGRHIRARRSDLTQRAGIASTRA